MNYEVVIGGITLSVAALLYVVSAFLLAFSAALVSSTLAASFASFFGVLGFAGLIAALRNILELD